MKGFIEFIRKQGVIGLAIGFILGGAINKLVSSLVTDIVQPAIGFVFGSAKGLTSLHYESLMYGNFISNVIDFVIIACVIYFGFKGLKLEKLDMPKEEK